MITYFYHSKKEKKLIKQQEKKAGSWIFVDGFGKEDLDVLVSSHGYDELILEDALDYFEVPRSEIENGIVYFFTRYPVNTADGEASTAPMLLAINSDNVLTTNLGSTPQFILNVQKRDDIYTTQKTRLFLEIMEEIAKSYNKNLSAIRKETTKYFGNFSTISDKDIEHFVGLESTVSDYISAVKPTRQALEKILSGKTIVLHVDDADLVKDLMQDMDQLLDGARSLQSTIQSIRDGYSTILANKLNRTIRFLTSTTIILTVPTLVASIFGMNIWIPFGKEPISFTLVMLIMFVTTGAFALLLFFNR